MIMSDLNRLDFYGIRIRFPTTKYNAELLKLRMMIDD